MKFRTKPFEIEAELFDGGNFETLYGFCGWEFRDIRDIRRENPEIIAQVHDHLHDTWVGVKAGQWIIKGQKGEFYPCDPEIFEAKYERILTEDEKWATIEMDNGRKVRVPRRPLAVPYVDTMCRTYEEHDEVPHPHLEPNGCDCGCHGR